jgi:hypothetical protein
MGARDRSMMALGLVSCLAVMVGCKADIPRPPDTEDDAGTPAGPSGLTADGASVDVAADLPPTCGVGGLACCPGNICTEGGCCLAGKCVAKGSMCSALGSCVDGSCGGCGAIYMGTAQVCCDQRVCTGSRSACAGTGAGTCQACGGAGQLCCGDGFCQAGLACDRTRTPDPLCAPR